MTTTTTTLLLPAAGQTSPKNYRLEDQLSRARRIHASRLMVLECRERNYHDDSDWYALVWNPQEGKIEETFDGTTRFAAAEPCLTPDAPLSVREAADDYLEAKARETAEVVAETLEIYSDARGRFVTVEEPKRSGKNKLPKGTRCLVKWEGRRKPSFYAKYTVRSIGVVPVDADGNPNGPMEPWTGRDGVERQGRKMFFLDASEVRPEISAEEKAAWIERKAKAARRYAVPQRGAARAWQI